jgi:hypothetical protein
LSELHRETFRAVSVTKNKHTTFNKYGIKNALRDNRLKILAATKAIRWNLLMKRTNIKRNHDYVQSTMFVQNSPSPPIQCTADPCAMKNDRHIQKRRACLHAAVTPPQGLTGVSDAMVFRVRH